MVKEIEPNEMKNVTEKASALYDATKSGKGTPVEIRCAEAVLEQARNTERQARAYKALADSVTESTSAAAKAAEDATACLREAMSIDTRIIRVVNTAVEQRLVEVIPSGANSVVEDAKKRLGSAAELSASQIEDAASMAAKSISRSVDAAIEREKRAKSHDGWHQLSTIGKVVLCTAVVAICVLQIFIGSRFLPVVTGEAQITYASSYQSELDNVRNELTRTQNELNAYKDAYPEGLSEQRLHDLNELNRQV